MISANAEEVLNDEETFYPRRECDKCNGEIKTLVIAPVDDMQRIKLANSGRLMSVEYSVTTPQESQRPEGQSGVAGTQ